MTDTEIAEYKESSKNLFSEIFSPSSLVNINLEDLTITELVSLFLSTKATKTDFAVLMGALKFWDKETSFIYIESYEVFRSITKITLTNPNLSRAFKSLEGKEFIKKSGDHNRLEYFFEIPYGFLRVAGTKNTKEMLSTNKTTG